MMNQRNEKEALLSALREADSVLLFAHISPDGDTLGSTLALKLLLERMGKRVQTILDGDVPENLAFLPGGESWEKPGGTTIPANALAISVDVSCEERLGAALPVYRAAAVKAVIDHHGTNDGFGEINWIDGDAPATAILIHRLYQALQQSISKEEAICLYTALATDTGNFVYQSVNAEAFSMMTALMESGLPLAEYSRMLFRQKQVSFVRLLGKTLPSLRLSAEGRVAGLSVSLAQMKEIGADAEETDGVVDYAIDLKGVRMAYFLHEKEDGQVKVSLRALSPYRIDKVAASFGGGGHQLAAGCGLDMPMDQAAERIEAALAAAYREQKAER